MQEVTGNAEQDGIEARFREALEKNRRQAEQIRRDEQAAFRVMERWQRVGSQAEWLKVCVERVLLTSVRLTIPAREPWRRCRASPGPLLQETVPWGRRVAERRGCIGRAALFCGLRRRAPCCMYRPSRVAA